MTQSLSQLLQLKSDVLEKKTDLFFTHLNELSDKSLSDIKEYIADFDTVNGKFKNTANNRRLILEFGKYLTKVLQDKYKVTLNDYQKSFEKIEYYNVQIQNINNINYEPNEYLRKFVINTVFDSLTLDKIIDASGFRQKVQNTLYNYVTGEMSRQKAVSDIQKVVIEDEGLTRYAKVISNDALRIYDGKIQQEIQSQFDMDGYFYNGTIIETSRPQCRKWVNMGFIEFKELKKEVELWKNAKGYDENMKLTFESFSSVCGGYNCRHSATIGFKPKYKV